MSTEPARISRALTGPVSLDLFRGHLLITNALQDAVLESYLAAAVDYVETKSGRAISDSTFEWVLDGFPDGQIVLPIGPTKSVAWVRYLDADGVTQTISADDLLIDLSQVEARIAPLAAWPEAADRIANITVRWTVGAAFCPPALHQAVLLLATHWFENRSAVAVGDAATEIPLSAQDLIKAYRRFA